MEVSLFDETPVSGQNTEDMGTVTDSAKPVTVADITMILCVRLHEGNPWVLERLDLMAEYYAPCPPILIVDFGSGLDHAAAIASLCKRRGYTLVTVPDFGVFSLAASRNIAFQNTSTDFVFFCDPDFFGERDMFQRLAQTAEALNMRSVVDVILNPPAYHLSKQDAERFEQAVSHEARSSYLRYLGWSRIYTAFDGGDESFIAPYSNVFMMHRSMFSMVGGYDSNFRGHGSEDFEFLLRLAMHSMHLPMPKSRGQDLHGPFTPDFFRSRPYEGFRRLFELMSQPTESLGFKVFHLWHERRRQSDDWYKNNDWKRNRFQESSSRYLEKPYALLGVDYLKRPRKVYCLCRNKDTWGYFVPLRLAGFELLPVFSDDKATVTKVTRALVGGAADAVAIFNPYMSSHSAFASIVASARELGRRVIVLERGALPHSIYYSDDVCYKDESFSESAFLREAFSEDELRGAEVYIRDLRQGRSTLESMDAYAVTQAKYLAFGETPRRVCFVPLQLEDDMAVTMFTTGEQSYAEFVARLPALIDLHPDVFFIVKPHPLSKIDKLQPRTNLLIADRADNVHALLDVADLTLCYNSGVGLLSLLHGTPIATLGNAFYNLGGAGYRARSADDALERFLEGCVCAPPAELVKRIAAWFIYRKYSFFLATDNIVEFKERKAHGYKDIAVTEFRWDGIHHVLARVKQSVPFSWRSYAAFRLAISDRNPGESEQASKEGATTDWAQLEKRGRDEFHARHYDNASALFLRAYHLNQAKPNLLRYAAESLWQARRRRDALARQTEACRLLPGIKRVRLRLLTMKYPWLSYIILGSRKMKIHR